MNELRTIDRTETSVQKLLDRLERWEKRFEGHSAQKRDCIRQQFRGKVTVYIPPVGYDLSDFENSEHINVWTRNISQSGICFVASELITATHVVLCLRFSEENAAYYRSALVRRRQVDESLWEYGVEFRERVDPSSSDASGSDSLQESAPSSGATPESGPEVGTEVATPADVNDGNSCNHADAADNAPISDATTDSPETQDA